MGLENIPYGTIATIDISYILYYMLKLEVLTYDLHTI